MSVIYRVYTVDSKGRIHKVSALSTSIKFAQEVYDLAAQGGRTIPEVARHFDMDIRSVRLHLYDALDRLPRNAPYRSVVERLLSEDVEGQVTE